MENESKKDNFRTVLAIVLIGLGFIWLLKQSAPFLENFISQFKILVFPFRQIFMNWGNFIFSWEVILILTGLILLAGKRSLGLVLIVLGGLFLAPKILFIPQLTLSFLLPVILVVAGIVLIAKRI